MRAHLILKIQAIFLLLLGLFGAPAALAITIPQVANCYSGDNGYDLYIANNSALASIQANNIFNGSFYETGTGTFKTTPPSSLDTLSTGAFCYHDKSDYTGNWLSYTVGGVAFKLQFHGSGDNYFLNLQAVNSSDWTTTDGDNCPGESSWSAAISAKDTSTANTICSDDYIVNIATAGLGGSDNGVLMTVIDNPAGTAGGSQTANASSANSARTSLVESERDPNLIATNAIESGHYMLASRIFNKTRWSVLRNPETLALSGMSYAADGLQHGKFLHCTFLHDDGNADIYRRQSTYNCKITEPCTSQQCAAGDWQVMGETVSLPETFFTRRPIQNAQPKPSIPPVGGDSDIRQALELLPASINQRKIHQTPDGKVKVMSVNLLKQEWALAYDGQNLFAMVPHGAMGQPRFVQCRQTASSQAGVVLDCYQAYRCQTGNCNAGQWVKVSEVKLPSHFFSMPEAPTSGCVTGPDGTVRHCYWKRPR